MCPFLPFRRGRRNKTKFAEATLSEKDGSGDSARTETADLTRSELGARAANNAERQATRADIHEADDTSATRRADSESSDIEDSMSEGGGGGKKKRGKRGKKSKNKNLNSSKDGGGVETKQPPKNSTGETSFTTNGVADDGKVLQEVVENDIVPVSASAAQLSSAAPSEPKSGSQHGGKLTTENGLGVSLDFIDVDVDSAGSSNQASKENDSKVGAGGGDGSVSVVTGDEGESPVLPRDGVGTPKADKEDTDSTGRDSLAEIEAEAEAMLALQDVSMSPVSSKSLATDSSTGAGGGGGGGGAGAGDGKLLTVGEEEKKAKSAGGGGGLKKILRRKISQTLFNVDLDQCDPEIVVSLLKIPSVQTFGALKKKLKVCVCVGGGVGVWVCVYVCGVFVCVWCAGGRGGCVRAFVCVCVCLCVCWN